MRVLIFCILAAAACASGVPDEDDSNSVMPEKQLAKHLLDGYAEAGIHGRPVHNASESMEIKFGVALISIHDLDVKHQALNTRVWIKMAWNDPLLTWNPDDYSGVSAIRIPTSGIWSPDIVLYNAADVYETSKAERYMAYVTSNGDVLYIPAVTLHSFCQSNFTDFPQDVQTCYLKFGSWTYDGLLLDVQFFGEQDFNLGDYIPNNRWELLSTKAKRNVKHYACCPEPYVDLTFTMTLKRKPGLQLFL